MEETRVRAALDNIVGALVYFEQTTGAEIPQGIFDKLSELEGLVFSDRQPESDIQYELEFTYVE